MNEPVMWLQEAQVQGPHPQASPHTAFIAATADVLAGQLRVTARTAYVAAQPGSQHVASEWWAAVEVLARAPPVMCVAT